MQTVVNVTWWELRDILAKGDEFQNSTGKFRGLKWEHNYLPPTGHMAPSDRVIMQTDLDRYGIDYVVWSYGTPIGWRRGDGVWFSPDAGYTMTTKTKHLSRFRPAIAEINN